MRLKSFDMFGMLTIEFTKAVRLIENLNLTLSRYINSSNLNLTMIPALNRNQNENFNKDSLKMNWEVSN